VILIYLINYSYLQERIELKLTSHGRKVEKLGRPTPEIDGLVVGTDLSSLITCSLDTWDKRLLSAFAKRWHKETSSFHLPIGEMSITWWCGIVITSTHYRCLPYLWCNKCRPGCGVVSWVARSDYTRSNRWDKAM